MSSRTLNKIMLIGNVGQEPRLSVNKLGTTVCSFSLATNREWTVKRTGQNKESTQWHEIVTFAKLAEICGQILTKGTRVYVSGRIQTLGFENEKGERFSRVEIVANEVEAFEKRKKEVYGR